MLNFKQQELQERLLNDIRARFPEVEHLYTTPSPETPGELWIHVTAPADEDREIALLEYCGEKVMDIHLDYGYPMLVLPIAKPNGTKAQSEASTFDNSLSLNLKQQELKDKLLEDIRTQFPEVEYLYTTPSPESAGEIWIHVTAPEDEDRELELIHFSGDKAMDILLDYGYPMLVFPISKANGTKAQHAPSPLGQ